MRSTKADFFVTRIAATLAAVAALTAALLVPTALFAPAALAQTVADIQSRDTLIASQEALLNVYRCRFDIDTEIVEGGCSGGAPARSHNQPAPFTGTPTAGEVAARDKLIADQEALLNVYRCRFNIDTEIVPGNCEQDVGDPGQGSGQGSGRDSGQNPGIGSGPGSLNSLVVEAESEAAGFRRADFDHDRAYLCDKGGADPYTNAQFDSETCEVDYIVDPLEAFESGAWKWDSARRRAFGNDALNLVPTRACVNQSKGAGDLAEWSGQIVGSTCDGVEMTAFGRCFLASETIAVKSTYSLSVDTAEKAALMRALEDCPDGTQQPTGPTDPHGDEGDIQTDPISPSNPG